MAIHSKLPHVGTTIFSVMSRLAARHQAINLSQGFPNFDCDPRLQDLVCQHIKAGRNQYAPMPGLPILRERLAAKIENLYQTYINPDTEITITAGATQAIFSAITALIHPGDEVILFEPAYDCYEPAVTLCGGQAVALELSPPAYEVDWKKVAAAISPNTKMIVVNTPHNPTGRIWSRSDWKALIDLVRDTDIVILSDEVYEHLVFDDQAHQSVLNFPELEKRSLAVYSFGKTFHNTGWKIGYAVGGEALMKEFRKVHQFNVFSVNTPIQYALADYLEDDGYIQEIRNLYEPKRDLFAQILADTPFDPIACQGTYFMTAKYKGITDKDDLKFANWMTEKVGVAVIPISVFYQSKRDERVVRFCFAKTQDVLEAAGERLRQIDSVPLP